MSAGAEVLLEPGRALYLNLRAVGWGARGQARQGLRGRGLVPLGARGDGVPPCQRAPQSWYRQHRQPAPASPAPFPPRVSRVSSLFWLSFSVFVCLCRGVASGLRATPPRPAPSLQICPDCRSQFYRLPTTQAGARTSPRRLESLSRS